jgi:hypothetical protein
MGEPVASVPKGHLDKVRRHDRDTQGNSGSSTLTASVYVANCNPTPWLLPSALDAPPQPVVFRLFPPVA